MFKLKLPFKTIKSKKNYVALGILEYSEEPHNFQNSKDRTSDVVRSLGLSLKGVYEVETRVEQSEKNSLSTKVSPIEAELDKREIDINLEYFKRILFFKEIENICRRMREEKKDNAIILRSKNIYLFHGLKDVFDAESTGNILKATKKILLESSGQRCKSAKSEITSTYLKVYVEVETPYEFSV